MAAGSLADTVLARYIEFLNTNFPAVQASYRTLVANPATDVDCVQFDEFFDDWAQANFELLVERLLCPVPQQALEEYGCGSDYETELYGRVFFHDLVPTHEIVCVPIKEPIDAFRGVPVDLFLFEFESFVAPEGKFYSPCPPFDHVLLSRRGQLGVPEQVVIPVSHLRFEIQPISEQLGRSPSSSQ